MYDVYKKYKNIVLNIVDKNKRSTLHGQTTLKRVVDLLYSIRIQLEIAMVILENLPEPFSIERTSACFSLPQTSGMLQQLEVPGSIKQSTNNLPGQNIKDAQTDKIHTRLQQLKFMMEDHLEMVFTNPKHHFGFFLGQYIDRLGIKHKTFAETIHLMPTELSQILNYHRRPKDKLAFRLDIHSGGSFPALLWFRIIQKDRYNELFMDDSWLQREKVYVKSTLGF